MSSDSSVNDALADYAAGRITTQQLVGVVATAYYGDGGRGRGDGLRPVIEVIERAHPGVIELVGSAEQPGFAVRLADRPFPKKFDAELREVVAGVLNVGVTCPPPPVPRPSLFTRIVRALRRVFSA